MVQTDHDGLIRARLGGIEQHHGASSTFGADLGKKAGGVATEREFLRSRTVLANCLHQRGAGFGNVWSGRGECGGFGGRERIDVCGRPSGKDHRAARFAEIAQQLHGCVAQGFRAGHDDDAVAHGPEMKGGVFSIDGSVFREVRFVAVIEIDLRLGQCGEDPAIKFLQLFDIGVGGLQPGRAVDTDLRPDAFHRIEDQHIADWVSGLEHDVQAAEVGFDGIVFRIPRRLERDAGRVIALRFAGHGIPTQMVATHIDAEEGLPVADALVVGEIRPPSAAAIQFREHPRPVELTGDRGELLDHPVTLVARAENIHARVVEIWVVAHHRTAWHRLGGKAVLVEGVSGEEQSECMAMVEQRPRPILEKEPLSDFHVGPLHRGNALSLQTQEKFGQLFDQVIAEGRGESFGKRVCPGRGPARVLGDAGLTVCVAEDKAAVRLVGEDPADARADAAAARMAVGIVRHTQKILRGRTVHGVEICGTIVERVRVHVFPREDKKLLARMGAGPAGHAAVGADIETADLGAEGGDEMVVRRPVLRLAVLVNGQPQVFHAVLEFFRGQSAGRSAGPAVFVVEPRLQAERFSGVGAGVDAVEPLASEVRRLQSGPRVHEIPAEPHFFENADLTDEFSRFQPPVPAPERFAAVSGGRVLPFRPGEWGG